MRRWMSASSLAIFSRSMPVRRCSCSSMMAWACFSVSWVSGSVAPAAIRYARSKRNCVDAATSASRASFGDLGSADQPDHFVDVVERQTEAEQDVLALAGFAQFVIGTPANDVGAMLDEVLDGRDQAQLARLAVDDREIDDAEADLQLRVLVEVVENDVGLFAALQLEDDAHAVAVALVANFRNAFDLFLVHQRGGVFDEPRLVDLIRNFGDDDVLRGPLAHGLDFGFGADLETAAAGAKRIENSLTPEDETAGGEVRAPARSP